MKTVPELTANGGTRPRAAAASRTGPARRRRRRASSSATTNGLLLQLDAKTGKPIPGPARVINLGTGIMDEVGGGGYRDQHAAGALQEPGDHRRRAPAKAGRYGEPGDPRAFNLLTGKEVWRFHVVPHAGEENYGTWGLNGWQDGARAPACGCRCRSTSANDLVFIPTRQRDRSELRQQPSRR